LASDFAHLADAVHSLDNSGVERLHVDVMDGVFVPNFTFGTDTVRALKRETDLPLELHLMIVEPERHLETFAEAGADAITVHYEASPHLHRSLTEIRKLDCRAGAAINPSTPASCLDDVLEACDLALVMTINPGFGGQKLIERTLTKVRRVRERISRRRREPPPARLLRLGARGRARARGGAGRADRQGLRRRRGQRVGGGDGGLRPRRRFRRRRPSGTGRRRSLPARLSGSARRPRRPQHGVEGHRLEATPGNDLLELPEHAEYGRVIGMTEHDGAGPYPPVGQRQ